MTVQVYTGLPGSGKSYHGVREALWWSRTRLVVANFAVTDAPPVEVVNGRARGWMYLKDEDLTLEKLLGVYEVYLKSQHRESCALLCMDEAQRMFNTREWNRGDRKSWVTFFSLHRHLGFDCVLVCQDLAILDGQVKAMCAEEVRHRRVNRHFPFKFWPRPVFATVTFQMHTRLKGQLGLLFFKPKVAGRYDSLHEFDMGKLAALVGVAGTSAGARAERGPRGGGLVGRVPGRVAS